jgi:hypothetical protein
MKRFIVLLIFIMSFLFTVGCCTIGLPVSVNSGSVDFHEFQTALNSSVLINLRKPDMFVSGSASGVAFKRGRNGMTQILTAGHVCLAAVKPGFTIWIASERYGLAQGEVVVIWGARAKDLCVVETILDIPVAKFAEIDTAFGVPVWNVSAPAGNYPIPLKGYVASVDKDLWRVRLSMYAQGGMSGSGIWQDGKLVGIVSERVIVAPYIPTSDIVMVIPSWRIEEFLTIFNKLKGDWGEVQ